MRLKVTVKKWGAMRQSIDLNRKNELRGDAVTVMFHGSVWRFCDSNSVSSCFAHPVELSLRAAASARHSSKVAVMQHPRPRAGFLVSDFIGQSRSTVGNLTKMFLRTRNARSAAFHIEGSSSSGCGNAGLNLTNQKSEQRRCFAA